MKRFLLSVGCLISAICLYAQAPTYKWAKNMGGPNGSTFGWSIMSDAAGNVYTAGSFQGTVDFDPGPNTFSLTYNGGTKDIFVTKLDASGNFVWAKSMGGTADDVAKGLAVDPSGNVYLTGSFGSTVDFDPGAGNTDLTASNYLDIFIVKLNTAGNLVWVNQIGGSDYDYANAIALDGKGNMVTTGSFTGTVDFDPGANAFSLTATSTPDAYILKLDTAGKFVWAKNIGENGQVYGLSITTDGNGNVFTTGNFSGTVDFDPGANTVNLSSPGSDDIFISKLNASGNFVWARSMGGTMNDYGNDIAVDASGNVYTTGYFDQKADFNPGAGVYEITATSNSEDVFVSKLNDSGNFVWAKNMGGSTGDKGNSIALDAKANVFTIGSFQLTGDFDPGTPVVNLISEGTGDIFLSKLNKDGNYVWAKRIGGTWTDYGFAINTDISGNIYATGGFGGTVDFDPGTSIVSLTTSGQTDVFVLKLNEPVSGLSSGKIKDYNSIYPNPTNGHLNIEVSTSSPKTSIEVYNCIGTLIETITNVSENNSIDLTNYTNGLYMVKIISENSITTQKIIKR